MFIINFLLSNLQMKTFALAALAATTYALEAEDFQFVSYIAMHNKQYSNIEEFNMRKELYLQKDQLINEHNAAGHSWTLGHNKFSDWTHEEY